MALTKITHFLFRLAHRPTLLMMGFAVSAPMIAWLYFQAEWRWYVSPEQMKSFAGKVNDAPALSDEFYGIYDRLKGKGSRKASMEEAAINATAADTFGKRHRYMGTCWCTLASKEIPEKKPGGDYKGFRLGWGLQQYAPPEKCFDYEVWKFYTASALENNLAPPDQLRDTTEILRFMACMEGPSISRHPERMQGRMDAWLWMLRGRE